MKRLGVIVLLVGIVSLATSLLGVWAEPPSQSKERPKLADGRALPLCPVGGEPINLAVSTTRDDGPVYLGCAGCIKKLKADPDKYAAKFAEQRRALAS